MNTPSVAVATAARPPQGTGFPVVHIVDDEEVVRDALAWLLRSRRFVSEGFASADAFAAWLVLANRLRAQGSM